MEPGNPLSPDVSAVWKSVVVKLSGTAELIDLKIGLNTCYMVMQEVNHQLFTETVLDEVLISMEEENQEQAEEILAKLDLIGFKDRHPMSLSGGQKQRIAIASAIASKRSILEMNRPAALIIST